MALFAGSVRLVGDSGPPLDAVASIGEGRRLSLKAAGHHLGDWSPEELYVDVGPEGFVIQVEGEELVFMTPDSEGFAVAVGVGQRSAEPRRHKAAKPKKDPSNQGRATDAHSTGGGVAVADPPRVRTGKTEKVATTTQVRNAGIVVAVVAMAVFARPVLSALLMLVGGAGLITGVASTLDSYIAVRIPQPFTVTNLLFGGMALVAVGAALTLI